MSYDVDVMQGRAPDSDDEAWRSLEAAQDEQGEPAPKLRELHDRLTARFPCISTLADEEIDGPLAVWASGPLWHDFLPRIGRLAIQFPKVDAALPFILETARDLDLVVFDWQTKSVHRGDGLYGYGLDLEGRYKLYAPTLADIDTSFDRISGSYEPGFLILDHERTHDYAQTLAGEEGYIVEWREHRDGGFRHYAAGLPTETPGRKTELDTNSGVMNILANECLSAGDARSILRAFAAGESRPDRFVWRDASADYPAEPADGEPQPAPRRSVHVAADRPWWKFWG